MQATESVPAVDGTNRRDRSRCVDAGVAIAAHRAARHTCDSAGPVPAADPLQEPRVEDGRRDHRLAACDRPRRPCAIRLLVVSRGHDERMRVRAPTERHAVSAEGCLSADVEIQDSQFKIQKLDRFSIRRRAEALASADTRTLKRALYGETKPL